MAVDSVCPQGPTAVGKSDTAVELAKQLQLQGRKAKWVETMRLISC